MALNVLSLVRLAAALRAHHECLLTDVLQMLLHLRYHDSVLAAVGAFEDSAVDDLASEDVWHALVACLAWRFFAPAIMLALLAEADASVVARSA